jgi:hypothetical protein
MLSDAVMSELTLNQRVSTQGRPGPRSTTTFTGHAPPRIRKESVVLERQQPRPKRAAIRVRAPRRSDSVTEIVTHTPLQAAIDRNIARRSLRAGGAQLNEMTDAARI